MNASESYDTLVKSAFDDVSVDKQFSRRLKLEAQGIPTFVAEWLIDRKRAELPGATFEELQDAVLSFVHEHLPRKSQKEVLRNRLFDGDTLMLLDLFRASVDLSKGKQKVQIPCLDEWGEIEPSLLQRHPRLLEGGLWGAGKVTYVPPSGPREKGHVMLRGFNPLQAADVSLDYYRTQRSKFRLEEWTALLINSMGYNPEVYAKDEQRRLLLTRLLPLVQRRINLVELAPKGTGKSYVFSNLSRYARMISGGKVSPAVLFFNNSTQEAGLLSRFDTVVFDEAQTLSFDNPGEIVGILKDYLESGRFTRGNQSVQSQSGVMFLGNLPIGPNGRPSSNRYFESLPQVLQETALIDRIHGLLPGWRLPKIEVRSPSEGRALKADYFGEILHQLRDDSRYDAFVEAHTVLEGEGGSNMRNATAIKRLASGYLKLFFPDLQVTPEEYEVWCLRPSTLLRQYVCDQLSQMDAEYAPAELSGRFKD